MSCNSKADPIQLTWSNNTLTSDGKTTTSGIVISVGSPPQQVALTPVFILNNTYVNNIATCGSDSNSSCISQIGGGFNPSDSSTYAAATVNSWNGSTEDVADLLLNKGYIYFNDEVQVGNSKIPDVPLLLQATGTMEHGGIGLGKDSAILKELYSTGMIPSMSFSLFTGLYSASQAGMLILGGYAERFYQGVIHEHPVASYCTACTNITGVAYQIGDTSIDLLANRSEHWVRGIIEPYLPTIGLPDDVAYAFGNATGGTEVRDVGFWNFEKGKEPNASLVITLESGLVTTIPHDALFTPPAYTNGLYDYYGYNKSRTYSLVQPWSVISKTSSSEDPKANAGWLGLPYTAYVYIIRDYEREVLRLAAANQNAIVEGNATVICPVNTKARKGGSKHVGAIVGGVIGGLAGLALIALLVWFFLRRRKRSKTATGPKLPTIVNPHEKRELHGTSAPRPIHEVLTTEKGELAADNTTQIEELGSDDSTQVEETPKSEKPPPAELPA